MNFRHYAFAAPFGAIAENLVNTFDVSLADPEHLRTPAALGAFLAAHGIERPAAATEQDLAGAQRVRSEVRAVFEAPSSAAAVDRIARMLTGAQVEPGIVAAGRAARILWSVPGEADAVTALRSATAFNLAYLIAKRGFDRLRICGGAPCADVFLDVSRPGTQRFCGSRCATRTRVAAHRARQERRA